MKQQTQPAADDWLAELDAQRLPTPLELELEAEQAIARKHVRQGRIWGLIEAVIFVTDARNVSLTPEQERRIESCDNLHDVMDWVQHAALAEKGIDVFEPWRRQQRERRRERKKNKDV